MMDDDPFVPPGAIPQPPWEAAALHWPASWLPLPGPGVFLFRLRFAVGQKQTIRFHVSADERYELGLDGKRIGRGPGRGIPRHWFFQSYREELEPGEHEFKALVWALGAERAPWAQLSAAPGFCCAFAAPHEALGTGGARWEIGRVEGITFLDKEGGDYGVPTFLPTCFDMNVYSGEPQHWEPAAIGEAVVSGLRSWHREERRNNLFPDPLPPGQEQKIAFSWQSLEIPPGEALELVIPLERYYCFFPEITFSGQGTVDIGAAESLRDAQHRKLHRSRTDGNVEEWRFDRYIAASRTATIRPLWFRCGIFLIVRIQAGPDSPLRIEKLELFETGYPWDDRASRIELHHDFLDRLTPVCLSTLKACSHETWFDCPFYEQMMYMGDSRLEMLIADVMSGDRRLQRHGMALFHLSTDCSGLPASSFPSRNRQEIPTYSLFFLAALHDQLQWDPDGMAEVRKYLNTARGIVAAWDRRSNESGMVLSPTGWNHMACAFDASGRPVWPNAIPPGGYPGEVSPVLNMFFCWALQFAVALEEAAGAPERAEALKKRQGELAGVLLRQCYVPEKRLFSDDFTHTAFSEFTQVLAILSGAFPAGAGMGVFGAGLPESDFYSSHYYLEACRETGQTEAFFKRLDKWRSVIDQGLLSTPEADHPDNRSDCHAWSATPLFHFYATIAGIRPGANEFKEVEVRPQLGELTHVEGKLPHPSGASIVFDFQPPEWMLSLPAGVAGRFVLKNRNMVLHPGINRFHL